MNNQLRVPPPIAVTLPEGAQLRVVRRKTEPIDRTPEARRLRDDKIRELVAEGYSDQAIAEAVGISIENIRQKIRAQGLETTSRKLHVHRLHADRVMEALVGAAEPSIEAIAAIDWDGLDPSKLKDWQDRLSAAITEWQKLRNRLRRIPREYEPRD